MDNITLFFIFTKMRLFIFFTGKIYLKKQKRLVVGQSFFILLNIFCWTTCYSFISEN